MGDNDQKAPPSIQIDRSKKPSDEQMRQLYMASEHIEWTPFAKSRGWHSLDSRHGRPIDEWIQEKRTIIAREQAETIAEAVFSHRSRWHADVLKTLKEYPEANDAMLGILKRRLNDIIDKINSDVEAKTVAMQGSGKYMSQFEQIKTGELMALAAAIKICTESKHKSLMISDWSFKVAETFADPRQFQNSDDKLKSVEWKIEVMGGENLSAQKMQAFLGQWYDRPQMPHTSEEIENAPKPDDEAPPESE